MTQAGEQGSNVTRNAWLSAGNDRLPFATACTTVDTQCGSAQQANHLIAGLIAAGGIEVGIACGVEQMSHVPLGSNVINGPGHYKTEPWPYDDPPNGQFGAADRIADLRGITREDLDEWGFHSQRKAKQAWDEGRFEREVAPIETPGPRRGRPADGRDAADLPRPGPARHDDGEPGEAQARRRGVQAHGRDVVADLRRRGRGALDGRGPAKALGLRPRARLLHQVVTGTDPYYLLDGPVDATRKVLDRSGMAMSDFDVFEINEAFAAVVLSWAQVHKPDLDRVNVNGGAIALGHPVGSTGARLITTALHELERSDRELAFVTMCCGGSIGTASILQRI